MQNFQRSTIDLFIAELSESALAQMMILVDTTSPDVEELMVSYRPKLCTTLALPCSRKGRNRKGYATVPKRLHGAENREANGILIDAVRDVKGRGGCE